MQINKYHPSGTAISHGGRSSITSSTSSKPSSSSSSSKMYIVCCVSLLLMITVLNVNVRTSMTLSTLSSSSLEEYQSNSYVNFMKTSAAHLQHVLEVNEGLMQKARQYLERGNNECPSSYRYYYRQPNFNCEQDTFKDLIVSLPLRDYDLERRRRQKKKLTMTMNQEHKPHMEQKKGHALEQRIRTILEQHQSEEEGEQEEEDQQDVYHKFVGKHQEVKGMLHPRLAFPSKDNCVVYGMGIHDDSSFEQYMTKFCKQVHAFDCTVKPTRRSVKGQPFTFHQTCIGSESMIDSVSEYGNNQRQLSFRSLAEVMKDLGHDHIDLLKFDIEGSEWELFENEILQLPPSKLPSQLLFEFHTEGSNPNFVPPTSVKGRDRLEVNRLMLLLFDVGYRIIEIERNNGDPYCTEISMIRIQ